MRKSLSILALSVFVVVAATGLFVLGAAVLDPAYFPVLRLHVAAGWLVLALAVPALLVHARETESPSRGVAQAFVLVVLAFAPALAPFDKDAKESLWSVLAAPLSGAVHNEGAANVGRISQCLSSFFPGAATKGDPTCHRVGGLLAIAAILIIPGALASFALLRRPKKGEPARASGIAATILALWALATGVLIRMPVREHWLFGGATLHSLAGTGAIALVAIHLLMRGGELWRLGRRLVVGPGVGLTLVGVALGWAVLYQREHYFPYYPSTLPLVQSIWDTPTTSEERRRWVRGEAAAPVPKDWLEPSSSCRGSGCHDRLVDQWERSAHRFAADNRFYRAAVAGIVAERGVEEAAFCAACHDPDRLLTGQIAAAYAGGSPPAGSEGVSCVSCHAIAQGHPAALANGAYRYAFAPPYPSSAGPDAILLDPRAHRAQRVHPRTLIGEAGCIGCHRVRLTPDVGAIGEHTIQNVTPEFEPTRNTAFCTTCHLPFDEDGRYGHEMVGGIVDLSRYVDAADEETRADLAAHDAAARRFNRFEPTRPLGEAPMPWHERSPIQLIGSGALETSERGGTLRLKLRTETPGLGHAFPIGPMDLHDTWLELRVTDADGRTVTHLGATPDAEGASATPLRLGGRELDARGEPIRQHRIWTLAETERFGTVERSKTANVGVPLLPEHRAPYVIEARWLHRRAPPEFVRFALGDDAEPFPTWTVATSRFSVRGE